MQNEISLLTFGALFGFSPLTAFAKSSRESLVNGVDLDTIFDKDWLAEKVVFKPGDFRRLDESDDSVFYSTTRFVEHIDDNAVKALAQYHREMITSLYKERQHPLQVLDLASSWTSHIPTDLVGSGLPVSKVVGIGMNSVEMKANPLLLGDNASFVIDLNKPSGPKAILNSLQETKFDIALLQLSIDYLIRPVEVLSMVSKVMRPNSPLIITFSNRIFIDKAVSIWTGKDDVDHCDTVGTYMKESQGYMMPPSAKVLVQRDKGKDPLYAVTAFTNK